MSGIRINQLNLLPAWAVHKQQRRRLTIRLIAAEAVILLIVVLSVTGVVLSVNSSRERAAQLEARLADTRYTEPDQLAGAVKAAEGRRAARQAVNDALPGTAVDYAWLDVVNRAVPEGVTLAEIDIRGKQVTVTASADGWLEMERHRAALVKCGVFTYARFGAAARTDDGRLRYALSLEAE